MTSAQRRILIQLVNTIAANHVDQIQLAMGKSIAGYNFDHGHYSPGFARMIRKKLDENDIHVAVLGCYINPVNPDEKERQKAVAKFIEHLKYAKVIGADMVGNGNRTL